MKKGLIVLLSAVLIAGCNGGLPPNDLSLSTGPDEVPITPTRTVGDGSGTLDIDGDALGIRPGEVIAITPGSYGNLSFSNLNGTASARITLVANGLVEVAGGAFSLNNVSYLTVTGGATAKNLLLRDNRYRAIVITGRIPDGLTLRGIRMRNIADYAIYYNNTLNYDGTDATALTEFKLLNCEFENAGTVMIDGHLGNESGLINNGFCRSPEVANCSFRNSPTPTGGSLLYLGNTEDCNIHHNVIDNINSGTNNHNGIFFLKGNGSVHHNKCTNHQGNFVRFWLYSQGNTPKDVLLYNNIIWNSRKYSAFEVQSFDALTIPGVSTFGNAKVFNNTAGQLNTTTPTVFVGFVVDVYNLFGGDLQIFNNLSFNQVRVQNQDGIWSQQNITTPSVLTNNRYYNSASEAGLVDQVAFRLQPASSAKGAGKSQQYLTDDYYGAKRATPPSIGAVE